MTKPVLGTELAISVTRMTRNNSSARVFALAIAGGFLLFDGCALKMGKQPRQEIAPLYSARSPEFQQAAGSLLGPNFVPGNNITTLVNGNQIFPAMLGAIRSDKRSISLETYVFRTVKSRASSPRRWPSGRRAESR